MTNSEQEYKRMRPMMGSFLSIQLSGIQTTEYPAMDLITNDAFALAESLQEIFSIHSPSSHLNQLNEAAVDEPIELKKELYFLLVLALTLWRSSNAAFQPFSGVPLALDVEPLEFQERNDRYFVQKRLRLRFDLSGIAKGYIVDRVVEFLKTMRPESNGVVNAGGDLKFFNTPKRCTSLRLGAREKPVMRSVWSTADCVASSSPSVAVQDKYSSTRYFLPLRNGLTENHTAVVMSHCCCLADSLTKVALFGAKESIKKCAEQFHSQIYLFSPSGALSESYGET